MSNENKVRCQDCGYEYQQWFMVEVPHGGVFGEGTTVSCAACQNNEPRPAAWESEEVYRRRVTPFAAHPDVGVLSGHNLVTKWLHRANEVLGLEKRANAARDIAAQVRDWVKESVVRVASYATGEKRDEQKAAEGAGIIDALFGPLCRDCNNEAGWIRTDGKKWWFMCDKCDNARLGDGESYPIDDVPGLMSDLDLHVRELRRKLKKAKAKRIAAEMIVAELAPCSVDGCHTTALRFGTIAGKLRYLCKEHVGVKTSGTYHVNSLLAALEAAEERAEDAKAFGAGPMCAQCAPDRRLPVTSVGRSGTCWMWLCDGHAAAHPGARPINKVLDEWHKQTDAMLEWLDKLRFARSQWRDDEPRMDLLDEAISAMKSFVDKGDQ